MTATWSYIVIFSRFLEMIETLSDQIKSYEIAPFESYLSTITCRTRPRVRNVNRCRRGLETCPQANLAKMSHAIFFSFFQRVRATSMTQHRVENTRVHFWTFSPVSVKCIFWFTDNSRFINFELFFEHL